MKFQWIRPAKGIPQNGHDLAHEREYRIGTRLKCINWQGERPNRIIMSLEEFTGGPVSGWETFVARRYLEVVLLPALAEGGELRVEAADGKPFCSIWNYPAGRVPEKATEIILDDLEGDFPPMTPELRKRLNQILDEFPPDG